MNFLSKLFFKYFGPSFVRKHITTLVGALAGLIAGLGLHIDPAIIEKFVSSGSEILVALVLYFLGVAVDAKPDTPSLVKE